MIVGAVFAVFKGVKGVVRKDLRNSSPLNL